MNLLSNTYPGYSLMFADSLQYNNRYVWTSEIHDTLSGGLTAPGWASFVNNNVLATGGDITTEFRTSANADMSGATAYTATITALSGRYIQCRLKGGKTDVDNTAAKISDITATPVNAFGSGLMIEEGTPNLCLYSEELNSAGWYGIGAGNALTTNAGYAPDGTNSADLITASGSNNVYRDFTVTASTTYTWSFYARNNGGTRAQYRIYSNTGAADIVAQTSYFSQLNSTGFVRVTVTFTTPVGCVSINCYGNSDASTGFNAYLWGFQLEAKAYATSYLKTTSAAVTRNAESLTIPTAGFISNSAGTLIARVYIPAAQVANKYPAVIFDTGGTTNVNRILLYQDSAGNWSFTYGLAGLTWVAALTEGWHTFAVNWGSAKASLAINGVLRASVSSPGLGAALSGTLHIGKHATVAGYELRSLMDSMYAYKTALSDADMLTKSLNTSDNSAADFTMKFDGNLQYDARVVNNVWTSDRLDSSTSAIATGLT